MPTELSLTRTVVSRYRASHWLNPLIAHICVWVIERTLKSMVKNHVDAEGFDKQTSVDDQLSDGRIGPLISAAISSLFRKFGRI